MLGTIVTKLLLLVVLATTIFLSFATTNPAGCCSSSRKVQEIVGQPYMHFRRTHEDDDAAGRQLCSYASSSLITIIAYSMHNVATATV
jgi:hypothetical protein